MGYVYLIGEIGNENRFKIGATKCKDINKRLKQLQTGNSNPLFIKQYFETNKPFKLETMLHHTYKDKNVIGEWFEMEQKDIDNFQETCEKQQKIIDCLKDNPFF